jgi:hypothetical protein
MTASKGFYDEGTNDTQVREEVEGWGLAGGFVVVGKIKRIGSGRCEVQSVVLERQTLSGSC